MPAADVTAEAITILAGDLRTYENRVVITSGTLRASANRVREFVNETVSNRRRNAFEARASLDRITKEDENGTKDARFRLDKAVDSFDRATGVQSTIDRILDEAERATSSHRRAVEIGVASAQVSLAIKAQELGIYLESRSTGAPARGGSLGGGLGADSGASNSSPPGVPNGIVMVPLSMIEDADTAVTGEESFGKGYSTRDLAWAHNALIDVVLPTLAQGGTLDTLTARDVAEGRVGARSYADTYSGFFGTSSIALDQTPNGYQVTNGYHRIWVARELGLETVPARVGHVAS